MTFKAPDKLPYDEWFHDNPLKDSKYIDTPMIASENISVHQQMYEFCTKMLAKIGGSENSY
jgi:hypothetical protein